VRYGPSPSRNRSHRYCCVYGGISLYAAGVLDQPSEKALIAELSAMNAGK
jgi:hypothetical protein